MEHPELLKAQKFLKSYFSYFKHDNILIVSEEKTTLPFAYLIKEKDHPDSLLVSLAIDYCNPVNLAKMMLLLSQEFRVVLSEVFYIAKDGQTYFSEDAYFRFEMETLDMSDIEPVSKEIH